MAGLFYVIKPHISEKALIFKLQVLKHVPVAWYHDQLATVMLKEKITY